MKVSDIRVSIKYKPVFTCHFCGSEGEGDRYCEAQYHGLGSIDVFIKNLELNAAAMPIGWSSSGLTKVRGNGSKYCETVFRCTNC